VTLFDINGVRPIVDAIDDTSPEVQALACSILSKLMAYCPCVCVSATTHLFEHHHCLY